MSAPSVFISYAREDGSLARTLYKRLLNAGFVPWMDEFDLEGGEDWDRAISKALGKSDFVVLCLSKASISKRGYLQRELKMALDLWKGMLRDDIYLLPVRLDACELPGDFAGLQRIDIFEEGGWGRLVSAIRSGMERRGTDKLKSDPADRVNGTAKKERSEPHTAADNSALPAGSKILGRSDASPPRKPGSRAIEESTTPTQQEMEVTTLNNTGEPIRPSNTNNVPGVLVPYIPEDAIHSARWTSFLKEFARIPAKWFFMSGLTSVLVGNLFLIVGHSEWALTFLFDLFGFDSLRGIDTVMRSTTVLLISVGYFLLAVWFSLRARRSRSTQASSLFARLAPSLVALAIGSLNLGLGVPDRGALPRVLSVKLVGFFQGWSERLVGWQAASGGITSELTGKKRTQVWTTAQALSGILIASRYEYATVEPEKLWKAFEYIESGRSKVSHDGWAYWDDHTWTVTEVTGWVVVATANALRSPETVLDAASKATLGSRLERDLQEIIERQHSSGGWTPIKKATLAVDTRTYSTLMAVWALLEAKRWGNLDSSLDRRLEESMLAGARWLLANRHPTKDWVPNPHRTAQLESFPGLTAQVIFVLSELEDERSGSFVRTDGDFLETKRRFLKNFTAGEEPLTKLDSRTPDADVLLSVSGFLLEGSTYLGFPWIFATTARLVHDNQLRESEKALARRNWVRMALRAGEVDEYVRSGYPYVTAENLYSLVQAVKHAPWREASQAEGSEVR